MFNGAYLDSVFGKYGSSLGPGYVFSNGFDYRFCLQVNTFDFVSMIFGCRVESNLDIQACMQPFSLHRETRGKRLLFLHTIYMIYDL